MMFHWLLEGHWPKWTRWTFDREEARRGNYVEWASCRATGCNKMRFRVR